MDLSHERAPESRGHCGELASADSRHGLLGLESRFS